MYLATEGSNVLVDVTGIELNREEMIKFDMHVVNKASPDWKDALLDSHKKLEELSAKAREYEAQNAQPHPPHLPDSSRKDGGGSA